MSEIILIVLLMFTPYYGDQETTEERTHRMTTHARAIERAVEDATCTGDYDEDAEKCTPILPLKEAQKLRALLITIGNHESGFAKHVHEHRCRVDECDGGRAVSNWQFQRVPDVLGHSIKDIWYSYRGSDQESTDNAAWAAALMLIRGFKNCGSWEGSISQYATGGGCHWKGAQKRIETFHRVQNRLKHAAEAVCEDEADASE